MGEAKEKSDWIEEGYIVLMVMNSAWISGLGIPTLQNYDWKEKKVIIKEETLGERYG